MDESLGAYERQRNALALPGYEANCAAAAFPPPPEVFERRAALRTAAQAAVRPRGAAG